MSVWNIGLVMSVNVAQLRSAGRIHMNTMRQVRAEQEKTFQHAQKYQRHQAEAAKNLIRSASMMGGSIMMMHRFASAAASADMETRALGALLRTTHGDAAEFYRQFRDANRELRNFAPAEVIGRMRALAQAGYNQQQIYQNTAAVLRAVNASMGAITAEGALELGVMLERGFGSATRSMSDLLDVAVQGSNQFPMTLDKISTALGYATETAVAYNQSIEDVITSIGLLIPVTKTASKAGTAYRAGLASLTRKQTVEFMKTAGIKTRDEEGFRPALAIFGEIRDALQGIRKIDEEKKTHYYEIALQKMFGKRGKAMFTAFERLEENAVGSGIFKGRKYANAYAAATAMEAGLGMTEGAAKNLADRMLESAKLIDQEFKASIEGASDAIGQSFLPVISQLKSTASATLQWLTKRFEPGGTAGEDRGPELNWGEMIPGLLAHVGIGGAAAGGLLGMKALVGVMSNTAGIKNLFTKAMAFSGAEFAPPSTPEFTRMARGLPQGTAITKPRGILGRDILASWLGMAELAPSKAGRLVGYDKDGTARYGYEGATVKRGYRARFAEMFAEKDLARYKGDYGFSNLKQGARTLGAAFMGIAPAALGLIGTFSYVSHVVRDTIDKVYADIDEKTGTGTGDLSRVGRFLNEFLGPRLDRGGQFTSKELKRLGIWDKGYATSGRILGAMQRGEGPQAGVRRLIDNAIRQADMEAGAGFGAFTRWSAGQEVKGLSSKAIKDFTALKEEIKKAKEDLRVWQIQYAKYGAARPPGVTAAQFLASEVYSTLPDSEKAKRQGLVTSDQAKGLKLMSDAAHGMRVAEGPMERLGALFGMMGTAAMHQFNMGDGVSGVPAALGELGWWFLNTQYSNGRLVGDAAKRAEQIDIAAAGRPHSVEIPSAPIPGADGGRAYGATRQSAVQNALDEGNRIAELNLEEARAREKREAAATKAFRAELIKEQKKDKKIEAEGE